MVSGTAIETTAGQHGQSARSFSAPLTRQEIIDELMACLSLVRPVTMDRDHVKEWLAVAMREVATMRPTAFKAGCAEARQQCSHHGQIVPTIINGKAASSWREIGSSPFLPKPHEAALQLSDNREVQQLIESTANDLTRR